MLKAMKAHKTKKAVLGEGEAEERRREETGQGEGRCAMLKTRGDAKRLDAAERKTHVGEGDMASEATREKGRRPCGCTVKRGGRSS